MVLARQTKVSVISRSAIKSLRAILQEDFLDSVHCFLEESCSLHSELHNLIESSEYAAAKKTCNQFADSCNYIGAEKLSNKLLELAQLLTKNQSEEIKDILAQVDQLYDLSRVELQAELTKPLKKAG